MLRTQEEKQLDRQFTNLETWDEFLTRWNAADTVEEAKGLLHTGADIHPFESEASSWHLEKLAAEKLKRISFYLLWSRHEHPVIASTAQKLLVSKWLRRLRPHWRAYLPDYIEINRLVLEFLANPPEALSRPPYPKFIGEYLVSIHLEWHTGSPPEYGKGRAHMALQGLTDQIATALCTWGMAAHLASDGWQRAAMLNLEAFLIRRGYNSGLVFLYSLAKDMDPTADSEIAERRAAEALLKLKYWIGSGVNARMTR